MSTRDEIKRHMLAIEACYCEGFAPPGGVGESAIVEASRRLGINHLELSNEYRHEEGLLRKEEPSYFPDPSLFRGEMRPKIVMPEPEIKYQIVEPTTDEFGDKLLASLRRRPHTAETLAQEFGTTRGKIIDAIDGLKTHGVNLHDRGGLWAVEKVQAPAYTGGPTIKYESRPDNTFLFGVTSDNHLGSKYERLDALNDCYDRFAEAKVDRVFNSGNWIEGEARFNRTEIHTHGMDAQLEYMAKVYPKRDGLHTYAVAGDDHEGWYAQREGVDIGRYAERIMHAAGRDDWHDLGYMEAHVELVNHNTGKTSILAVVHPGGGSSYADSYVVQKIIESLDGGEKPAVALYGHYHKSLAGEYRNVWWVLVPSTKDQDTFMRKKRIRSVVGGGIIGLEQDPETGAIIGMSPKLWRYFNTGYYENRWSHSGNVNLPERTSEARMGP